VKIHVVSIEDSLISAGVRKVSAFIRTLNPDTTPYYIPLTNFRSFKEIVLARNPQPIDPQTQARLMGEPIADADIVAFSSMTHVADQTKAVIAQVRRINPRAYVIWGGIHPIVVPEDAIQHADAICTGEGEFAFAEFFEPFRNGRDFTAARNFWFNHNGRIIRNGFLPLMNRAEMDSLPLPTYGRDEWVFRKNRGNYTPLTRWDYVDYIGPAYNTVWTIGCPFKCTFCGNTKFLENDRDYAKLRHSGPQWIVDEVNAARRVHPHIANVVFHDDSFLALPLPVLQEFAALWRSQVGIPFCILGVIPNYVRADKLEVLLEAGLNRIRMGIQSGSRRILQFYKRPAPPEKIVAAAEALGDYAGYMMPPTFDMILDNPVETREDVVETLELLYRLRRPYTFNLFSLRVTPNTELAKQFEELHVAAEDIGTKNYTSLAPTFANCLFVLTVCWRPPRRLFERLLRYVKPVTAKQRKYPVLLTLLRLWLLSKRAFDHFRWMDFSLIPGRITWALWRIGLVGFWQRRLNPKFSRAARVGQVHQNVRAPRPSAPLPVLSG